MNERILTIEWTSEAEGGYYTSIAHFAGKITGRKMDALPVAGKQIPVNFYVVDIYDKSVIRKYESGEIEDVTYDSYPDNIAFVSIPTTTDITEIYKFEGVDAMGNYCFGDILYLNERINLKDIIITNTSTNNEIKMIENTKASMCNALDGIRDAIESTNRSGIHSDMSKIAGIQKTLGIWYNENV